MGMGPRGRFTSDILEENRIYYGYRPDVPGGDDGEGCSLFFFGVVAGYLFARAIVQSGGGVLVFLVLALALLITPAILILALVDAIRGRRL